MASKVARDMPLLVFIKQFYDVAPIKEIVEWFLKSFYVDYSSPNQEEDLLLNIAQNKTNSELCLKILSMLKDMGVKLQDYEIKQKQQLVNTPFGQEVRISLDINTTHNVENKNYTIPLRAESNGTQKLFGLVPLFIISLTEGRTIFVDELDSKLHPKLLESIIKLYTNKDTNTGGGQLIFTSHDMTTMSPNIFRRDEIYFMSLSENQDSELFSLVEIRGKDGRVVRNDGSFSKQYLEGRYGADPYFSKMKSW
jgi:AAA15 family ATPase/GTPase